MQSASKAGKNTPLFLQQRFLPMWTALSLGAFTDNMLKQALSIAILYGSLSVPLISNDDALPIIGSLFPIAMLLFSTVAGQVADKNETSIMFRRTKFFEFLLMIIAAIGFLTSNAGILIITLFLMGAQSAFFSPVRAGAMPKYLSADELVRGNAICGGGLFVSVMVGIVVGGLLIEQPGGPTIVSAILVIAAFIGWQVIRKAPEAPANAPDLKIDWNIFRQTFVLAGFAVRSRGVIHPILGVAFYWTIGALVSVAAQFYVRDNLGGDESVVTTLMGLFAIGAAIGAIIASRVSKGRSGLGYAATSALIASVATLFVFVLTLGIPSPSGDLLTAGEFFGEWRAFGIAFAFLTASTAMSIFAVPLQAAVQRRAPADRRSRILAANNMLNAAGAMIGSWLVLFVTRTEVDPLAVFLGVAIAQFFVASYMFARRHKVADGLYDEMLQNRL